MKLIVGLGNPGKEYDKTRHNIGFMALDNYLGDVQFKTKDNYSIYEKEINGEKVMFLKPLTYMNDSGAAIRKVMDYYKIDLNDLLIIYDDMDFEVGKFKIKRTGSSAGHNGIKSIISYLRTEDFKRVRVGISKHNGNSIDFVLGRFSNEDSEKLKEVFSVINRIIEDFVRLDFNTLMNKYN